MRKKEGKFNKGKFPGDIYILFLKLEKVLKSFIFFFFPVMINKIWIYAGYFASSNS